MDDPLFELGRALREASYAFVAPTPETHRRVNARPGNGLARDLRGVFGWSRPFSPDVLPARLLALLQSAGAVEPARARPGNEEPGSGRPGAAGPAAARSAAGDPAELLRSRVRFSTLCGQIFVHSAYPTLEADSVFFGPDTNRFASLLLGRIQRAGRVVDVGCGSGAGGILLAPRARSVVLADINPLALRYARINAALAGVADKVEVVHSDVLASVEGPFDLVVANPPYLADERGRAYRDGGGPRGIDLSVRIAREGLSRLPSGGRLLLYTATPIEDGVDPLRAALAPWLALPPHWPEARQPALAPQKFIAPQVLDAQDAPHPGEGARYEELDPDVFGEELERPSYASADRIAVVALDATRP